MQDDHEIEVNILAEVITFCMDAFYQEFLNFNSLWPSDAYMYMRRQANHHWYRKWLVAWTAPSHYLNHCWNIVNWTLWNKLQWNCNRNSNIFIKKMHLKMSSAKWRPFCLGLNVLIYFQDFLGFTKHGWGCVLETWYNTLAGTWAPNQYKDVVLPVKEISLWR